MKVQVRGVEDDRIAENLHMIIFRAAVTLAAAGTAIYAAEHHWRWEFCLRLFGHDWMPAWIFGALLAAVICPNPSRTCR
jgi:hypothetical protein